MLREMTFNNREDEARTRDVFVVTGPVLNDGINEDNIFTVKKSLFRRKNAFLFLVMLIVLLAALLLILIIFCNNYDMKNISICKSNECLRTASNLRLSMNLSVDPCDDFYKYTCGKWSKENINHGWFPYFSNFYKVQERIIMDVLTFLNTSNADYEPFFLKQSRRFYESCISQNTIRKLTFSTITKYLKTIGLPVVPNIFMQLEEGDRKFDWINADVKIKKILDLDLFVGIDVLRNRLNVTQNLLFFQTPELQSSFPNREILVGISEQIYKKYAKYIIESFLNNTAGIGFNDDLDNAINSLWEFKQNLASVMKTAYFPYENPVKTTIAEFQAMTEKYIIQHSLDPLEVKDLWQKYLKLLFEEINIDLNPEGIDFIYYYPSKVNLILDTIRFLMESPDVDIEFYTWYQVISTMFVSQISEELSGQYQSATERARYCADIVKKYMPAAVSYAIIDKNVLNTSKSRIDSMITHIKAEFKERIQSLTWMDSKTKEAAIEKNSNMLNFIGYPEWLFNETVLEKRYENISIRNNSYLDNIISVTSQYVSRNLKRLTLENQREWQGDPMIVDAFYFYDQNSIHIPLGIIAYPFYNLGLEALNYGALGSVIGHELIHGFDMKGRQYDKVGNYLLWWTSESRDEFNTKIQCFIDQYNKFKFPNTDEQLNSAITVIENMADNGGLNQAFRAYNRYVKEYGNENYLPGFLNYSNEQLFFLAFAQIYCQSESEESWKDQLSQSRSPGSLRVIGSLQNSMEFAKAFNCPVGSNMNPRKEKCVIW